MIRLIWDGGPERPTGLDDIVRDDLRRSLTPDMIAKPSRLVTHHVKLTKDWHGPGVNVAGRKGSDAFHCVYMTKTKWVSLRDDE